MPASALLILVAVTVGLSGLAWLLWRLRAQGRELQRLRQTEARLAMALDASDAALWEWYIAEQRMVLSPRYFEQLGYPPGDHEGSAERWRQMLHPDDAERAIGIARDHLRQSQNTYINEYRLRDAQGQWRWMLSRGRVTQRSADGRPVLMVGTHIDISAMKAEQAAAMALQQRFQNIYDTAPDGMGITRISDSTIVDVNPSFVAMTGHARDDTLGRTSKELGIWAQPEQREQMVERFRAEGQVDSMQMLLRHKDGRLMCSLMSARPLVERGERYLLFIIRDISEHQLLQQQAEAARTERLAAERASRAKTEFLSRMSHELRTPLNAVLGFAQLLQGSQALAPRELGQVESIAQAGWHLLKLINDVLDIASIEAGRLQLALGPLRLQPLLTDVLAQLAPQAAEAGIELKLDPPAALAHTLHGDPQRLRQALLHVIDNAIRYNRRGGQVRIGCRRDAAARRLLLQVSDNGQGLGAEQMAHLFEPFNRLGREREGGVDTDGTGIGLVLSQHLLSLMGASLSLASEPGRGTTATLNLRLSDSESLAPQLLYIEDNAVNQILVSEVVAAWPELSLTLAGTGGEGLLLAAELRPDLILLDMRLPDMDGLQVLQALKADPVLAGITVVALSASAMPDEVRQALAAGALDYWTKPLRLDRFLEDLRAVLTPPAPSPPR